MRDPRTGQPIKVRPSDPRAAPVKTELRQRFERCSRLVVLIGSDTHSSEWVEWEIEEFCRMKNKPGQDAKARVRGMRLKQSRGGGPAALSGRALATID